MLALLLLGADPVPAPAPTPAPAAPVLKPCEQGQRCGDACIPWTKVCEPPPPPRSVVDLPRLVERTPTFAPGTASDCAAGNPLNEPDITCVTGWRPGGAGVEPGRAPMCGSDERWCADGCLPIAQRCQERGR